MKIRNQLVKARNRTAAGTNRRLSITVHETANRNRGAGAQAHANLQSNGNVRVASWHIQVDDREAIRSFPDTVRCWHAGGGGALDSIAVEICVNSDSNYAKALANAAEVVRQLRTEHGIDRANVVQHNDWTGKHCPTILRGRGGKAWSDFVASTDPGAKVKPAAPARPKQSSTAWPNRALPENGNRTQAWHDAWTTLMGDVGFTANKLGTSLQRWLAHLGYYKRAIDGDFGPWSVRALQTFLRDRGHYHRAIDGDRGPRTVTAEKAYLNSQRRFYS